MLPQPQPGKFLEYWLSLPQNLPEPENWLSSAQNLSLLFSQYQIYVSESQLKSLL
ncbi:hypothetical protein GXM_01370 [Nostoc sphaeroides CCNUC1]|uniref:Uncharacterized protein n=1 Tax=Nostoc sphaeroides CCNUC1 TaxID=2653204 RepID=A0A5P8VU39_9NOSO|nr:hypothetical protein GXM_01370 [Nostoc sphaeroides CCNUC1]